MEAQDVAVKLDEVIAREDARIEAARYGVAITEE